MQEDSRTSEEEARTPPLEEDYDLSRAPRMSGFEDKANLLRTLYLYEQLQPRFSIDPEKRPSYSANLRLFCRELGVSVPEYLQEIHQGIEAERAPDGSIQYVVTDPSMDPDNPVWPSPVHPEGVDAANPRDPNRPIGDHDAWEGRVDPEQVAQHEDLARYERKLQKALRAGKDLTRVPFHSEMVSDLRLQMLRRTLVGVTKAAEIHERILHALDPA